MTKSERYLRATGKFVADAPECRHLAKQLRKWVEGEVGTFRSMSSFKRLRCFAGPIGGRDRPLTIAVELAAPNGRSHNILIRCDGVHRLDARTPHVVDLAAGLALLTLLTDELKILVRLQP